MLDSIEEMVKFLETYYLPKMNQEENKNMNRLITSNESVIKKFPSDYSPGPECFTGQLYQTFKEELIPILLKLCKKN